MNSADKQVFIVAQVFLFDILHPSAFHWTICLISASFVSLQTFADLGTMQWAILLISQSIQHHLHVKMHFKFTVYGFIRLVYGFIRL